MIEKRIMGIPFTIYLLQIQGIIHVAQKICFHTIHFSIFILIELIIVEDYKFLLIHHLTVVILL